ncbi:MAG TPA: TonB family protein [Stellaceae bacterium]|nr:TonB family protein [Stellaceae bacterium]
MANAPHSNRVELGRWSVSFAVVLLLHVAAGLYLLWRPIAMDAGNPLPPAIMIDLAPAPSPPQPAPPIPVPDPAVEPQVQPLVPLPPLPPMPDIPLPKVEPSPAPRPAVVIPKPPPPVKQKPVEQRPQIRTVQPPPPAAPAVTAPPAPAAAPPAGNPGATRASWQAQLVAWLERYKRYPRLAQEQHQEGTVYLRFTMDRSGHVLSAQIEKGSGFSLLDEEVTALIRRAQPLPAPPPEVPGAQLVLTLPVQFSVRGGHR